MRRIAVRAIIEKDEKLLLARLKHSQNGTVNDFYCTIGGGLDEHEGLIDGLKREVLEETGVKAEVGKLLCIQQYKDSYDNLEFFFHITNANDFMNIDLSKTSHGAAEIKEIGFYDPQNLNVLPKFLKEIGVDELLANSHPLLFNYF